MEEHNKFDEFLRKNFDEEWELPEEMAWEQMNIDTPAPKRKRKFPFWIFFLAAFAFSVAALWLQNDIFVATNSGATLQTIPAEATETYSAPSSGAEQLMPKNKSAAASTEVSSNALTFDSKQLLPTTTTTTKTASNTERLKQSTSFSATTPKFDPPKGEERQGLIKAENQNLNVITSPINQQANQDKSLPTTKEPKLENDWSASDPVLQQENGVQVSPSPNSPAILEQLARLPLLELHFAQLITLEKSELPSSKTMANQAPPKKGKGMSLQVLFGRNFHHPQFAETSALRDKITPFTGLSLRLALQKKLKNNFSLQLAFDYQALHTVFQHSRELETRFDIENRKKITVCEHTYQNNYSKLLSTSLGLFKHFDWGTKFNAQVGIFAAPTYLLQIEGKTLLEDDIVLLEDQAAGNKFYVDAGTSLGLSYRLNPRLSLLGQYQLWHTLGAGVYLDTTLSTKNRHQFLLGLSFNW